MVAPTTLAPPADQEDGGDRAPLGTSSAGPADAALGALLAGAGLVHVAMAPAHLTSSAADGVGFLVVGVVQLLVAVLVVARPSRAAYGVAAGVSAVALGAWLVSRTVGLPYGAHEGVAESVAFVDGATAVLEGLALIGAGLLLARGSAPRVGGVALKVLAVGAVALSVAAIASPSAREHGHDDAEAAGGHGHGTEATGDDLGYSELVNGQMGAHEHSAAPADELDAAHPGRDRRARRAAGRHRPARRGLPHHRRRQGRRLPPAGPVLARSRRPLLGPGRDREHRRRHGPGGHRRRDAHLRRHRGRLPPRRLHVHVVPGRRRPRASSATSTSGTTTPPPASWSRPTASTPRSAPTSPASPARCARPRAARSSTSPATWSTSGPCPGYESPEGLFSDLNPQITCPDGTYYTIETRDIGGADTTCLYP